MDLLLHELMLMSMVVFTRSVVMSSFLTLFLMFVTFILGFWLGVHSYRDMLRKKL